MFLLGNSSSEIRSVKRRVPTVERIQHGHCHVCAGSAHRRRGNVTICLP